MTWHPHPNGMELQGQLLRLPFPLISQYFDPHLDSPKKEKNNKIKIFLKYMELQRYR